MGNRKIAELKCKNEHRVGMAEWNTKVEKMLIMTLSTPV